MYSILVLFFTLSMMIQVIVMGQELQVDCIETLEDFERLKWKPHAQAKIEYATSGQDLPGDLAGMLEGDGILYFNSSQDGEGVSKQTLNMSPVGNPPYFLYVKYYAHEMGNTTGKQIHILKGGVEGAHTLIPVPSEFTWGQALVELQPIFYIGEVVGVSARYFDAGDLLLIDQLILTQGYSDLTVDTVQSLCFN